ncbi:replicative DNA helicase [Patescibacteria group bacterium]
MTNPPDTKLPPQNIEAEESLLGSIMLDKDAIVKIADVITPEDFYTPKDKLVYESMLELYEHRDPIDVLSLSNKLKEKKQLEDVGGSTYLTKLVNTVPTATNVTHYAGIVRNKATLRRLISVASNISELGYQEEEKIEHVLDKAEQQLFGVSQKYLKDKFIPLKDVLVEAFDRIDELHKSSGKMRGIPTGFADLDNILSGLQNSDLIILAARPSVGKTALALDIARHIAVKEKIPVGLFSLEMSKEQLVDRLLCAEAKVNSWKMRTGKLGNSNEEDDFARIGQAMGILSDAPLFIDDSATSNVMEIRTKARRLQLEHDLGFLVIDYLQLMEGASSKGGDSRVQEVSEISRALKGLARELNIPVLAISQLSRAVESRSPQIPRLSDLRESGSIEQDADVVLFIYREERENPDTDRKSVSDILVSKHRNGPVGQIELHFQEQNISFSNLAKKRSP